MKKSFNQPTVSSELALAIIERSTRAGKEAGVSISIAVVDPALQLIAFLKTDGSMAHSIETSKRKAQTAASTRKESGWMQGDLALTLPLASGNLLTNVPGGVPIIIDGKVVGGFGVAGGTVEQDAEISNQVKELFDE